MRPGLPLHVALGDRVNGALDLKETLSISGAGRGENISDGSECARWTCCDCVANAKTWISLKKPNPKLFCC